jgi:hypothetical protein
MDDRLERFISENREGFDFREPDPRVWKKIEKRTGHRKINPWFVMRRVAAVVLIFAASYAASEFIHRYRNHQRVSEKPAGDQWNSSGDGFRETEAYYAGLFNQKMDELKPVIANCPALEEELNYDMSELDSIYADLKKDLKDNMANQEVIEAIIENYRLKISILEDLLTEIDPDSEECLSNNDQYAL